MARRAHRSSARRAVPNAIDPPEHVAWRMLVDPLFTNRRVTMAAVRIGDHEFAAGARVYLNCTSPNQDEAVFGLIDGKVVISDLVSTRMAGPADLMDLESSFAKSLASVVAYHVHGDELSLSRDGAVVAVFSTAAGDAPAPK